jgi:hypothetical protein
MKAFTLYNIGATLGDTPPGFGLTVDYAILEGMAERPAAPTLPADLVEELRELAETRNCDFRDWNEHRFVQFVKRRAAG